MKDIEKYRMMRLGKRIKLQDVAKYVGCSNSTISRLENEKNYSIIKQKVKKYKEYIENYGK